MSQLTRKTSLRKTPSAASAPAALVTDLRLLIEAARARVAQTANSELTLLYWRIGRRINADILRHKRADYGKQIVATVSQQLTAEFGQGFAKSALARMCQLAEYFPDENVIAGLAARLSWSHFVEVLPLKEQLKRDFYAGMCRVERWSVRTLREKIGGLLYERTALSRKPERLIEQELKTLRESGQMTPDLVFRDPYLLDFLGLRDTYSERDLESAILREIERFLVELGTGFCFVARQQRITIGDTDYYLDLLFYHRGLRRLIALELKLEKFQAAHKGQMELYLRWLDKHERQPHEAAPLGLLLCQTADAEHIELLELEQSGIRVAEYLTQLPPIELLRAKLHTAIKRTQSKSI